MLSNLIFLAGRNALKKIRSGGLNPDDVKVIAGAAGGPKWLILGQLDRVMFSTWFSGRQQPLFLVGSSSGAWRFAAVCRSDPVAALDQFEDAYIHQFYHRKPTPQEVSIQGRRILNSFMGGKGSNEVLKHPYLRLNIMGVRCHGLTASHSEIPQMIGFMIAALLNAISRNCLKLFCERTLFSDFRDIAPFFVTDELPVQRVALTAQNVMPAMMSSGSIPIIMSGVCDIPGAPKGVYRDGGITDYHVAPSFDGEDGIVLLPHYTDRIIPGWLDKKLTWRKPDSNCTDNLLLVAPSPEFLSKLPLQKIPDRTDFKRFHGRDNERLDYWYKAVAMSRYLADDFMEAVLSGKIRKRVRPL
ncbi:patatin-like phospholipase family protein [Desulfococcaceae bacterium HSG9]|nr:patatin-like phospholipase family protein [Desulfococcaceae bacterium HSG9]